MPGNWEILVFENGLAFGTPACVTLVLSPSDTITKFTMSYDTKTQLESSAKARKNQHVVQTLPHTQTDRQPDSPSQQFTVQSTVQSSDTGQYSD